MIRIAVDEITERIRYTFDFIFQNQDEVYELVVSETGDLNYLRINGSFEIASLLYENDIHEQSVELSDFNGVPCYSFAGVTDPVATVFFVLSRYEEYLASAEFDEHGRFKHENSHQYKFNILEKPIADLLAREILFWLGVDSPNTGKVEIIPTFDIDNVYAYKLKRGVRRLGSTVKDLLKNDQKRISERRAVSKGQKDPYDTYDLIREVARDTPQTLVFWLSGGDSSYDRNVDILDPDHANLIRSIKACCAVGLHPSYSSYNSTAKISSEKRKLEKVIDDPVLHSRFHFLHFSLPNSYRSLIESGILKDYSMGYAGHTGFRAGTARSFLWYDLEKEEVTLLELFPFTYMDGTLNEYMKLSPEQAIEKLKMLHAEISICGGQMIGIWHNETIGEYNHWKGWSDVLKFNLNQNG